MDERHRFQSMRNVGSAGAARGMMRLSTRPTAAMATSAPTIVPVPCPPASTTPANVPSRMARNVPISSIALPPISSAGWRIWGSRPYFAGAKNVECMPSMKSAESSSVRLPDARPMPASPMIRISVALTACTTRDLSKRSASCPASPENNR